MAPGPDEGLWTPDESVYVPGTPRGDQPRDDSFDTGPADGPVDGDQRPGRTAASGGRRGQRAREGAQNTGAREGAQDNGARVGSQDSWSREGGAPDDRTRQDDGGAGGRRDRRGADGRGRGVGRWGAGGPVDESRDPAEVAREICLRQLAVRPRTRAELAAALARRGIDAEVAASVLDRYDEVGIIDDAAFARAWVTSRHQGRGLASRALANELRQRGVDKELADAALADLDDETQAATARDLVDRKLRSAGATAPDALFRRLVGALARKGYPPGLAIRVVKEALAARRADATFLDDIDPEATGYLVGDDVAGDQPID